MNILVIAAGPFPFPRGTPVRTLRVSEELESRGHTVCVAAFPLADRNIATKLRIEVSSVVHWYRKTTPGPSFAKLLVMNPRLVTRVRELLEQETFEAIYAHHYEGLLVATIARRRAKVRTPIVFDSHTLLGSELSTYFPHFLGGPVNWLGRILDSRLIHYADAVIGVMDEITNFYASRGKPDLPVLTATNGVEYERFIRASTAGDNVSSVRIVFAGNLSGYQGFDLLIAAFRKIRQQRQDIELMVAAPETDAVLASMGIENPHDEGILLYPGGFSELPRILASADIAVNPRTVCPGIPQKLLNYMAAALPTVSFEGSSTVLVHEQTGLIVPNGDIDGFAAAIMRLADASALRLRLGSAARTLVETEHNWEQVAVTFERVVSMLQQ